MQKILSTGLLLFFISFAASADQREEYVPSCYLLKSETDASLKNGQARYTFEFNGIYAIPKGKSIDYSIDGDHLKVQLDENSMDVLTTAGKHVFQFYYSDQYFEIYTDSLSIGDQIHATYSLNFVSSIEPVMTEKPVIYLYPEKETEVTVKLDINGTDPFFYPSYEDNWQFTAHPNGDLTFEEDTYNYLFWEAAQPVMTPLHTVNDGFNVEGKGAVAFLEKSLTEMGFTSTEKADFITYWGPRMIQHEHLFLHFVYNEDCDEYATLDITPKPDHIARVYMIWAPVSGKVNKAEQSLQRINRNGFTVVEWGGQETNYRNDLSQLRNAN